MLNIYTDGSCLGNPGPGGFAAIFVIDDEEEIFCIDNNKDCTTNNEMELAAVCAVLKTLYNQWDKIFSSYCENNELYIHSDSSYIVNAFKKNWITKWEKQNWRKSDGRKLAHEELWIDTKAALMALTKDLGIRVHFKHVRGHNGDRWNEECDRRARGNAKEIQSTDALLHALGIPYTEHYSHVLQPLDL